MNTQGLIDELWEIIRSNRPDPAKVGMIAALLEDYESDPV